MALAPLETRGWSGRFVASTIVFGPRALHMASVTNITDGRAERERRQAIERAERHERAHGMFWPRACRRIFYRDEDGTLQAISAADPYAKRQRYAPGPHDDGA